MNNDRAINEYTAEKCGTTIKTWSAFGDWNYRKPECMALIRLAFGIVTNEMMEGKWIAVSRKNRDKTIEFVTSKTPHEADIKCIQAIGRERDE